MAAGDEAVGLRDIYVEGENQNFQIFKVYEDYDEGIEAGPDIPMSPPVSEELDPDYHAFLLLKRGNPSSR